MLIYNSNTSRYIIDPHYWTIKPFRKIKDSDPAREHPVAEAKVLWIYHMYNPHSPFLNYRNTEKSTAIVNATFPKSFLEAEARSLQARIDKALAKNRELDVISDTVVEGDNLKPVKKRYMPVPEMKPYDPAEDADIQAAVAWYRNHLQQTSLWYAYESYKESMYNLSDIIRDKQTSAQNIRAASQELDTIPLKMEKMRQQAVKDEAVTLKISGDKTIKRSERLESYGEGRKRKSLKEAS